MVSVKVSMLPLPVIPGKMADQLASLSALLYSSRWFELLSVLKEMVAVLPVFVMLVIKTVEEPQLVASVPKLVMLPTIVPQPVTVALLEITRPLAKVNVPPCSCNAAAFTPSPTTNGAPLEQTIVLA